MRSLPFGAAALAMVMSIPAFAQQKPAPAPTSEAPEAHGKKALDPNERICEDIVETGSRLASRRYCATRAEWAERKRQDREAIEKAQLSPCVLTHNGGNGKPGC
jgi:hypothetical protein